MFSLQEYKQFRAIGWLPEQARSRIQRANARGWSIGVCENVHGGIIEVRIHEVCGVSVCAYVGKLLPVSLFYFRGNDTIAIGDRVQLFEFNGNPNFILEKVF